VEFKRACDEDDGITEPLAAMPSWKRIRPWNMSLEQLDRKIKRRGI